VSFSARLGAGPASSSDLATQVARLFFDRQLSKVEIASRLGISRFRVARLIDGALADGLVRIEYRNVPLEDVALARSMESRFGIDLCAVAAVPAMDGATFGLARLAASVLDGLIASDETIGIAWGSTLAAVVREMPARSDPSIAVVQLAGGSSQLERDLEPGELSRLLADRLGAAHHALFAPAFVESRALRKALLRQPDVADATDRFGAISLAIVGIGSMPSGSGQTSSSLLRSGVIDPATVARLVGLGAVGDLVVHPFDEAGEFIAPDLAERAMAIGVAELRQARRVVAVAAGPEKAAAIRGALASGVVRILVTDAPTARAVLETG
jgi:DNA-binding transcriptional regulator LsrR (DeoR family)